MIFTYLRRELRRRRKAQLVIAAGLALGIALVVIVNAVSSGMQRAQDEVLRSLYGLGTDMTVSKAFTPPEAGEEGEVRRAPRFRFEAGEGEQGDDILVTEAPGTLTGSQLADIAGLDGVADAAGGLKLRSIGVSGDFDPGQIVEGEAGEGAAEGAAPRQRFEVGGGGADFDVDQFTIQGTDVTKPELGPLSGTELAEGRSFAEDEQDAAVAVLDADYAAGAELAVGDTLTVKDTDFEIVGLVSATGTEAGSDVYLPLRQAQQLSDNEDQLTDIYVQASDSQQLDAIETAIGETVQDARVTTADDLADEVSGSLSTAADLADGVGTWLSYLVLGVSFLVAGLMASAAVSRRVKEFGTLKALGWTGTRVTGQVMSESLVTGLLGGALGLGLGVACAWGITTARPDLTAEIGAIGGGPGGGPSLMIAGPGGPQEQSTASALDIGLTAPVSLGVLALAVALAVTGGLIAGTFAAWRASRLRPADALRRVA